MQPLANFTPLAAGQGPRPERCDSRACLLNQHMGWGWGGWWRRGGPDQGTPETKPDTGKMIPAGKNEDGEKVAGTELTATGPGTCCFPMTSSQTPPQSPEPSLGVDISILPA